MRCTDLRVGRSPAAAAELFGATAWMRAPFCTFSALATWSVATCNATWHPPHAARLCKACACLIKGEGIAQRRAGLWPDARHGRQGRAASVQV